MREPEFHSAAASGLWVTPPQLHTIVKNGKAHDELHLPMLNRLTEKQSESKPPRASAVMGICGTWVHAASPPSASMSDTVAREMVHTDAPGTTDRPLVLQMGGTAAPALGSGSGLSWSVTQC